jgi:hypothetical protein
METRTMRIVTTPRQIDARTIQSHESVTHADPRTAAPTAYHAKSQRSRYTPGRSEIGRKIRYNWCTTSEQAMAIQSHSRPAINARYRPVSVGAAILNSPRGMVIVAAAAPASIHHLERSASMDVYIAACSTSNSTGAHTCMFHQELHPSMLALVVLIAWIADRYNHAANPGMERCQPVESNDHDADIHDMQYAMLRTMYNLLICEFIIREIRA